jgi:hypothetical protein
MSLQPKIMAEQITKDLKFWKIEKKAQKLINEIYLTELEFSNLKGIFSTIDEIYEIAESRYSSDSPEMQIVRARLSGLIESPICRLIIEKYGVEPTADALIAWGNSSLLQFLINNSQIDHSKVSSYLHELSFKGSVEGDRFDESSDSRVESGRTVDWIDVTPRGEPSKEMKHSNKAHKIRKQEESNPRLCSKCRKEIDPEWKNCPHCATPIAKIFESNRLTCPSCGKSLKSGWKRCPYCATNL